MRTKYLSGTLKNESVLALDPGIPPQDYTKVPDISF